MCKYTQCPIDPSTAARVCIVYIYIYVLATNSKTKVPLILPIVKEPSITRGNEIFNIHLVALLIYDPDLQVPVHFMKYTLYKVTKEHFKKQMTDQVFILSIIMNIIT